MNIQGLPKKIIEYFLIFLAIIIIGYLSFALAEHYGYLVKGILGLSVICLLYMIIFSPISNVALIANSIHNPKSLKDFILMFFLGVIVFIASLEIGAMLMLGKELLLK